MIDYNLELIFGTLKFFAVKKIRQTDKWQQRQTVVITEAFCSSNSSSDNRRD